MPQDPRTDLVCVCHEDKKGWKSLPWGTGCFMEKYGLIKIGCLGEFLTWEGTYEIKLSMRKKQDIEL